MVLNVEVSCANEEDERQEKWKNSYYNEDFSKIVSPQGDRVFALAGESHILAVEGNTGALLSEGSPELLDLGDGASLRDFAVSSDGQRVFALGDNNGPNNFRRNSDIAVVAYSAATGSRLWRVLINMPALDENDRLESTDEGLSIAASPDGRRVYVLGFSRLYDVIQEGRPLMEQKQVTFALDAITGQRRWTVKQGIPAYEGGGWIEVSRDSRSVYAGWSSYYGAFSLLAFRAFSPGTPSLEGSVLWTSDPQDTQNTIVNSIDLDSSGSRLYLAGWRVGDPASEEQDDRDWIILALRADTGQQSWESRFEGPTGQLHEIFSVRHFSHIARGVAASPFGDRVYVTGETTYQGISIGTTFQRQLSTVCTTIAYNSATGSQLWVTYHRTSSDTGFAIEPDSCSFGANRYNQKPVDVSPDGKRVYVTPARSPGEATIAYDSATGGEIWIDTYTAPGGGSGNGGRMVAAGGDGKLVFTADTSAFIHAYDAQP